MKLEAIKYCCNPAEKGEQRLEGKPINGEYGQWCTFGDINLIVGQNATGKTKTLNAIRNIADLLAGESELSELLYDTASYQIQFSNHEHENIFYSLKFKKAKVLEETLSINGQLLLERSRGRLFDNNTGKHIEFSPPDDQIVALARRDTLQHPFFENLYQWGKSLSHYRFGERMGKDTVARLSVDSLNFKTSSMAVAAFEKGKTSQFGKEFIEALLADMGKIGYSIEKIGTAPLKLMTMMRDFDESPVRLFVKETELDDITDQNEISQGMFRALSLIIQLNYSLLAKIPSCILIDDIGEGLDYERSKSLIDLIINKAKESSVQIMMTTNDRFVMNKTSLAYWSVIKREGQKSLFYNYRNSQKIFDEFDYTGLNNFDFFATEFYLSGFEEEIDDN
ncbi:MAG: AAA family ATPase [Pseudomonadota bacterium]